MNLHRLIYTSARNRECTPEEIEDILKSAKTNNSKKNITGVLFHSENRFLQYLEGDKDEIMALFRHIEKDSRHGGCMIRDFTPIDERVFPSWEMGYRDADSLEFNSSVSNEDREAFSAVFSDKNNSGESHMRLIQRFFSTAV